MAATLELDRVTKRFDGVDPAVEALADASMTVVSGELVAVMGPSGSGKTTLLNLAAGLDRPTSGRVFIGGVDLASLRAAELAALRRRRIGFVFQQLNLVERLTAAENVSLPLDLDGVRKREARAASLRALERVGLAALADRFPDELSGGEQQRVAIARAVVGERLLLLADEPTGELDAVTGESVVRLLRSHCDDGGSGVLVTHDARFAGWADRIVLLRDGHVASRVDRVA